MLVVEDDFLIRMHAAEMIEEAGFEVVEASNADEAVAILEARSNIAVVFTDIQMPRSTDGLKLARAVRDRWPPITSLRLRVSLMSEQVTCRPAGVFLRSLTVPCRSFAHFVN